MFKAFPSITEAAVNVRVHHRKPLDFAVSWMHANAQTRKPQDPKSSDDDMEVCLVYRALSTDPAEYRTCNEPLKLWSYYLGDYI